MLITLGAWRVKQTSFKFILGSEGEQNKRNVLFIAESQDDFFCFIPTSLAAKYEFYHIKTGLLQWNLDITKGQGSGKICSLNRGFVIQWNLDITNLYITESSV